MNIEFSCANCGANLKVLHTFAGKTIQCPKCTKKTPVPAVAGAETPSAPAPAAALPAPPPAAMPPALETQPPANEGLYLSFPCGNCGSGLKVLKSFAGKSILCPKCARKALVPGGAPASAPVAREKPKGAPAIPAPGSAAPSPVPVDEPVQPRSNEQAAKVDALTRQMRDMELQLEVARLKAEKAEKEKQSLSAQKAADRLLVKEELSVHFQAEMEAARQTITRLEGKVREATQQRLASSGAYGGRTAAQIEKELLENPDEAVTEAETAVPDAVMADISQSRFARYVRTSILIHVVLLCATSVSMIKGYVVKSPPPAEAGEAVTNVVPVSAVAPAEAAPAPVAPPAIAPVAPAAVPPGGAVTPPPAPKSEEAKTLQALPAPGEKPPAETQVNLGL